MDASPENFCPALSAPTCDGRLRGRLFQIYADRRPQSYPDSSLPGLTRQSIIFEKMLLTKMDGYAGLRFAEGASAPQAGQARV
jgi:hypothetical protein